jgi:sulfur-oxidizing protein SoxZ
MAVLQPRVQAPRAVTKNEVFQVRTLITHPMETGLRRDAAGHLIPRKIINKITCLYNNRLVFNADLHEAMAANPYLSFYVRAAETGSLRFIWEEDGGAISTRDSPLTVG